MAKTDKLPSETEWLVMETIWKHDADSLTSAEMIERLKNVQDMSPKTVRVLINRLCRKGMLAYTVDQEDSRVYHYYALKSREECLREKSRHFVDSYFSGSGSGALAALISSIELSDGEWQELKDILESAPKGSR